MNQRVTRLPVQEGIAMASCFGDDRKLLKAPGETRREARVAAAACTCLALILALSGTGDAASLENIITEPERLSEFGLSVAGSRDVTGDGVSDLLVGAALTGPERRGAVHLYEGADHAIGTIPAWSVFGQQPNSRFGASVAAGSDINGDGYPDVAIGAPDFDGPSGVDAGRVYIYMGSASGLPVSPSRILDGVQAGGGFGAALSFAGDVNGDGRADVLIGAPRHSAGQTSEGRAYLFLGTASGLATSSVWAVESNLQGARFGHAVAGAGDLNKDGFGDVVIGAPGANGIGCVVASSCTAAGRVYVYLGGPPGPAVNPIAVLTSSGLLAAAGYLGTAVAGVGDFDGDGFDDLAAGAPGVAAGAGAIRLYRGSPTGVNTSSIRYVGSPGSGLGASLTSAGDLDSDGYADIVAGAPTYLVVGMAMGRLYVFHGGPISPSSPQFPSEPEELSGLAAGMGFGAAVAPAFDANKSCTPDVIVGTQAGRVALVDGDNPCPSVCATSLPGPQLQYPADGATGLGTAVTLDWTPVTGAVGYRVSLKCQNGDAPLGRRFENTTAPSFSCTLEPGQYTWYVQARNTCGRIGSRSSTWNFTVGTGSNCRPVSLAGPADGAVCVPTSGSLTWDPLPSASGYIVEFGTRPGHPDVIERVTAPVYAYSGLRDRRRYYWRVKEDCICAEFSDYSTFETVSGRSPARPTLNPTASVVANSGLLTWKAVRGAVGYRVQLGTVCGSGTEVEVPGTSYSYGPLASGTTYAWRVSSRDSCGVQSAYTSCRAFTTEGLTGSDRIYVVQGEPLIRGASSAVIDIAAENRDAARSFDFRMQLNPDLITLAGWTLAGTRSSGLSGADVGMDPNGRLHARLDFGCGTPCPPGLGTILRLFVNVSPSTPLGSLPVPFMDHVKFDGCGTPALNFGGSSAFVQVGDPLVSETVDNVFDDEPMGFVNATSNSNLALEFSSISGEGQVAVERLEGPPTSVSFIGAAPSDTGSTRWIIEEQDLGTFLATVTVSLYSLPESFADPSHVTLYRRPTPGVGPFDALATTYDPELNAVSATVSTFSEFILGSVQPVGVSDMRPEHGLRLRPLSLFAGAGPMSFEIALPASGEAVLELFDVQGRRRERLALSDLSPGSHVVELGTSHLLPSGLYFARLGQAGREVLAKTLVVR